MVSPERLEADCQSLQAFAALNPLHVNVANISPDLRQYRVHLNVDAPVAKDAGYEIAAEHDLVVEIPDAYLTRDAQGFVKSRIRREGKPVFHPNSWASDGALCFDSSFVPAKSLAEQVHTAISLMQCRLLNHASPADWDADWAYRQHGDEIKAQVRQVALRLPRFDIRVAARTLPTVTS